jgi:hypothetical protein
VSEKKDRLTDTLLSGLWYEPGNKMVRIHMCGISDELEEKKAC